MSALSRRFLTITLGLAMLLGLLAPMSGIQQSFATPNEVSPSQEPSDSPQKAAVSDTPSPSKAPDAAVQLPATDASDSAENPSARPSTESEEPREPSESTFSNELSDEVSDEIVAPMESEDPVELAEPADEPLLDTQEDEVTDFEVFAMPTGRNYLTWQVTDTSGNAVGGATVTVQGPHTGSWGATYNISDCTTDPCHPDSMDQDPRPGHFAVKDLIRLNATGGKTTVSISSSNRYRMQPAGSIVDYQWTTSTTNWQEIPGSGNSPSGWPAAGPYQFPALQVAPRSSQNYCMLQSETSPNSYYSLRRNYSSSSATTIRRATHNATETSINQETTLVSNSSVTLSSSQTANALGITPSGVFYFAGQYGNNREVTTYRFDPQVDSAPYPVWSMDLLSPLAGYIVAGDATIYQGREEFYYAYYSTSPNDISGRSALRMHVYRYSAGNGSRTGEVTHVDVERPTAFTSNANAMNGDFSFDGENNLQFIMSDTNGGYTVSGSVNGEDLHTLPGNHELSTVPTIFGSALGSQLPSGQRQAVNGVTYTQGGRAIIQQGNLNALADPTNLSNILSAQTTLQGGGALVDLASCAVPTTVTVQKFLDGERFDSGDQFALDASRTAGNTTVHFDTETTEGNASGLQEQEIGPYAMVFDGTFRASETITANEANYDTTWACYAGDSNTPFETGDGRNLEFELNSSTHPDVVPGVNLRCVFTNETLRPQLSIEKTADPESGETVTELEIVDYTLTFDNAEGTSSATVDHIDHLRDVLDDADLVDANGTTVDEPVITASGDPSLATNWKAADQQLQILGEVPAGESRTVSFSVRVKENTENATDREGVSAPLAGYWLRNYLTPADQEPPATCEDPAPGDEIVCTEHPIPAWTVGKTSFPADGALIHLGGNVNYRVTVSKLNEGAGDWDLTDVVVTDDLTDVLKSAGWTPDATVAGGAKSIGIYLYETAAGGAPITVCEGEADDSEVDCVPAPQITPGNGSAPHFDSTWTLNTRAFDMPANIVRAEVWYTVTAGEAPVIEGQWEPEEIQWGTTLTNWATADSQTQNPQQCITGDDDSFNAEECQVTQSIQAGFFAIRKDGVSPDGIENNLTGHAFEVRDDVAAVMGDTVSNQMCTVQNWTDSGATPEDIPDVPWNVDPASYTDAPVDCAYLYPIESGGQQGRWRSQNLPAGDYWLLETQAPQGHQLLAEPVKFSVGDEAAEGRLTAYSADGSALDTCSSNGPNPTACVNPTGWLMVVQDPQTIELPLAGGLNRWVIISGVGFLLLSSAVVAGYLMRRRNFTS